MQPAAQALVGDRPRVANHSAHGGDGLVELLGAFVRIGGCGLGRRRFRTPPEQFVDLRVGPRQQVLDRIVVGPESQGRDQDQPGDPPGRVGGDLRGQHASKGVSDQQHPVQVQRFQQAVIVQGEVVDVPEIVQLRQVGPAGDLRRHDRVPLRQCRQHRIVGRGPPDAVEPDQGRSGPAPQDLLLRAGLEPDPIGGELRHDRAQAMAGAVTAPAPSPLGYQRSSYSLKRPRRWGMTCRANCSVL